MNGGPNFNKPLLLQVRLYCIPAARSQKSPESKSRSQTGENGSFAAEKPPGLLLTDLFPKESLHLQPSPHSGAHSFTLFPAHGPLGCAWSVPSLPHPVLGEHLQEPCSLVVLRETLEVIRHTEKPNPEGERSFPGPHNKPTVRNQVSPFPSQPAPPQCGHMTCSCINSHAKP